MTSKKKSHLSKSIIRLLMIIPILFRVIENFFVLVNSEIRQAKTNVIGMIILLLLATVLISVIWVSFCSLLFLLLVSYMSWALAIILIMSLNTILLIIVFMIIQLKKKALSLPLTSQLLRDIFFKHD